MELNQKQKDYIDKKLESLSHSKFRSSFHLRKYMYSYIADKGMDTIERHAYDFVHKNLYPEIIPNDGRQTPMKGHPVFIAQHACGCCCRGCLEKWHKIPKEKELSDKEVDYIVSILITWISRECK